MINFLSGFFLWISRLGARAEQAQACPDCGWRMGDNPDCRECREYKMDMQAW